MSEEGYLYHMRCYWGIFNDADEYVYNFDYDDVDDLVEEG